MDGNVIQVSGSMAFGLWVDKGGETEGNYQVPNPEEQATGQGQINLIPPTTSEPTSENEELFPSSEETDASPPAECFRFTPETNFFPPPSDLISERPATFDECCAQASGSVGKCLETSETSNIKPLNCLNFIISKFQKNDWVHE